MTLDTFTAWPRFMKVNCAGLVASRGSSSAASAPSAQPNLARKETLRRLGVSLVAVNYAAVLQPSFGNFGGGAIRRRARSIALAFTFSAMSGCLERQSAS